MRVKLDVKVYTRTRVAQTASGATIEQCRERIIKQYMFTRKRIKHELQ